MNVYETCFWKTKSCFALQIGVLRQKSSVFHTSRRRAIFRPTGTMSMSRCSNKLAANYLCAMRATIRWFVLLYGQAGGREIPRHVDICWVENTAGQSGSPWGSAGGSTDLMVLHLSRELAR